MTRDADVLALADRFMAALVGSDRDAVRAFYAPGATVWHNFDDIEQTVEQNLELFEWFAGRLPRRRYRIVRREVLPDGWFQQHVVEADLPDGRPFRLFACCIIRVKDGLITRIDEYVDRSQAAVLRESPRRD